MKMSCRVSVSKWPHEAYVRCLKTGQMEGVKPHPDLKISISSASSLPFGFKTDPVRIMELKGRGTLWLERDEGACFPVCLRLLEGADWTLVETVRWEESNPPKDGRVSSAWIGEQARLNYVRLHGHRCPFFEETEVRIERQGVGKITDWHMEEAHRCQNRLTVTLEGERAQVAVHEGGMVKSDLTSLLTVEHRAPRTCSFVLSKRVVWENGTSNFDGWIRVDPNARGSKARQMNYNLLMSNESRAISTPHLEVRTPDVECHHGTATRRLETEDLFYMNTRGVAVEEAKRLFVLGFANAIFERLPAGLMEINLDGGSFVP